MLLMIMSSMYSMSSGSLDSAGSIEEVIKGEEIGEGGASFSLSLSGSFSGATASAGSSAS